MTNEDLEIKTKGYTEIISAVFLWGLNSGITARLIKISSFLFYPLASLFGVIVVAAELIRRGKLSEISKVKRKKALFAVGTLLLLNNVLFYYAIQNTTIANAILLHYLAPLLVVLSAPAALLEEKRSAKKLFAALIGLGGMAIVLLPQIGAINIGIIAGFLSAIFYAAHTLIEKKLAVEVEPLVEVFYKNSVAAALSIVTVPIIASQNLFTFSEVSKVAFLGVSALGLGFILFFRGLGKVSSQSAMILAYLEVLIAIALGWAVFGEAAGPNTILGGLLIVGAGIAVIKMKE